VQLTSASVMAAGYRLHDREVGVRVPVGTRIISSPYRPDPFWDTRCHLFIVYQGALSPGCKAAGA
jgi:hypothetical protein